jgi:hypothetical protein
MRNELTPSAKKRDLIAVTLVPVEVFGADDGYGLCDAVSAWSDCNRAEGHIYRFEDLHIQREPGETLTVWVDRDEYEAFSRKTFGSPAVSPAVVVDVKSMGVTP